MSVAFFDITRQNQAQRVEIDSAIKQVIDSGRFILGENVTAFEKEVAAYCGAKHGIGVASGTDALHLSLLAAGVKPGDEVITSPFTFVATAEAIAYCNATPVFVDIEPYTFNLDPAKIEKKLTKKTKAILPVHLYGQACRMDKLLEVAKKHGLKVIEDCAQSIGAEFGGKKTCSIGDAGCLSFFPTKNLGCFGDGGMIVTNSDDIYDKAKVFRGHGSRKTYHYEVIGFNSRLDEVQAAILRVKFKQLEALSSARRKNAGLYASHLKGLPKVQLPFEDPAGKHVFNQFTLRVKDRDWLFESLKKAGVGAMVYYPLCLHLQEAFLNLGCKPGDFPEAEAAQNEVLSLPIYPELKEAEALEVCQAIKKHYGQG